MEDTMTLTVRILRIIPDLIVRALLAAQLHEAGGYPAGVNEPT